MVVYHDRNLIINYIPRHLTDSDLANLFGSVGAVKTCRIIRDRSNGASFGFGFCEYEDAESAFRAIERFNGYRIADKVLKVSLAKLQGRLYHSSNLYVKNLPASITDDHLLTEFARFGKVIQCRVLRERESDASKGSAYVLFEKRCSAEAAKKSLDGTPWPGMSDDQILTIKFAPPPYRHSISLTSTKNQSNKIQGARPLSGYNEQLVAQMLALHSRLGFTCDPFNITSPLAYSQDSLCAPSGPLFPSGYVPTLVSIPHQTPLPNILWPPEYGSYEAPLSMPMTNNYISPYYFIHPNTSPNFLSSVHPSSAPLSGSPSATQLEGLTNAVHGCPVFTTLPPPLFPVANQSGDIPSSEQSLKKAKENKTDKANSNSVYVYNIGNFMSENRLCELFSRFGVILGVSIPRDPKTNFARNFGFVSFNNFQSAQSAVNVMNGATCDGRRLQVSFRKPKQGTSRVCNNPNTLTHKPTTQEKLDDDSPNYNPESVSQNMHNNEKSYPNADTSVDELCSLQSIAIVSK
ncbi:ELAV-like protein 2 [Clonorchis sinensis]|uniref:ELAV-like protein 2 n=1 Tax=Clonorchis sinensis TaxID=79923 RepID=H2KQ35_CLOSI|nr:ELAV-like protein 2 [Clonorchis sinensis]